MPKRGFKFVASALLVAVCALSAVPVAAVSAQTTSTSQVGPADGQTTTTSGQVVNVFGQTTTTQAVAASASRAVAISGPHQGDTIVNTQVQIAGTAPSQALVSIAMVDADMNHTNVQHQPGGRIDGSVTSDASGRWVFVPAVKVVPGSFAVSAAYTDGQNPTVTSATVKFTVVNDSGQSAVPSASWTGRIVLVLVAIAIGFGFLLVWRRRDSLDINGWLLTRLRRDPRQPRLPRQPRPDRPDRRVRQLGPEVSVRTTEVVDQAPLPLFMSTVAGRSYQAEQARRIRAMDVEMKAIEQALVDTAEALERSNITMAVLRREINHELGEAQPSPADDPRGPIQP